MTSDLALHLHSEKCNEFIILFLQCRAEHSFTRFCGKCNSEHGNMTKCLNEERLLRRQKSMEKSQQTKERLRRLFKEEREREKAKANNS